jgi:hypothetical protein
VSGYLGIDLGGAGMAAALRHRDGTVVDAIAVPSGPLCTSEADVPAWGDWGLRGLKIAIPSGRSPHLCYANQHAVALSTVRESLVQQLGVLRAAIATQAGWDCPSLRGVMLTRPSAQFDGYCFNLREAVLGANLVQSPDQVFFVEAAIAALLTHMRSLSLRSPASAPGKTLVIHTSASVTELGLVDLSSDWESRSRIARHGPSFAYGDRAIAQDILGQMFYGALSPVDVSELAMPLPGQPDIVARDRLHQCLQSTPLGRSLWQTAEHLKRAFNQHAALEFQINGETRTVTQGDFHRLVLVHYLRRLHQEMHLALKHVHWAMSDVQSVICSGALASMAVIAHWLRQKFPQAHVVCLAGDSPDASLAAGLACLPLYPQLLDATGHQYSDLFLLRELLRILPPLPLPFARIRQLLEQGGINTGMCQRSLLRLLEGQLPGGLMVAPEDAALISSGEAPLEKPLFGKQETHYQVDGAMRDRLQAHLTAILTETHQTLVDPLSLCSLDGR